MARKISTEARLLEWIDTAPIEVVNSIMSIANARVTARVKASAPAIAPRVVKHRAVRKTNAHVTGASAATAFPSDAVTGASA